jgi:RNA polymerase sigma-70 factor (ECF subfamily)
LDTSVASVTSALQRARATLKEHRRAPQDDYAAVRTPSTQERELLGRYMAAHARADSAAVVALMREDIRFTMPPYPLRYEGIESVSAFFAEALGPGRTGDFRLVPTRANRLPAAANYYRLHGESDFRALSIDVLRFVEGRLVEITTFEQWLFPYFGLPEVLVEPTD